MNGNDRRNKRMNPGARLVIEDPTRPAMGDQPSSDAMGFDDDVPVEGNLMPDPPPQGERAESDTVVADTTAADYPDMEPLGATRGGDNAEAFAAGTHGDGYLRLVIEVENGNMELIDASVVDGPLVQTDLTGQMAYEATLHGRRVAADAFDDLSEQHAFPPPGDPTVGHRTTKAARFQFVARVPRSEVTAADLPDLQITLVRPSSTTQLSKRHVASSALPLDAAAIEAGENPPQVVARLEGISLDTLPNQAVEAVRSRLR